MHARSVRLGMFMGGGGDRVPRAIELEIRRWVGDDIRKRERELVAE